MLIKLKIITVILLAALGTVFCQGRKFTELVDPFIGTTGEGHTYPGAVMPFGMVQLSPDNGSFASGYDYKESTITGFSHTHLSGVGTLDYGDILLMPTVGKLQLNPGSADDPGSGYRSRFNHNDETASPGYYSVLLKDYAIKAEVTVTPRTGFHRYTFPESKNSHIILDLTHALNMHEKRELSLHIINDTEVEGMRFSNGTADSEYVYFYAEFSKPFKSFGTAVNGVINSGSKKAKGSDVKAYFNFTTDKDEQILVKVGISVVSIEGAKQNLLTENPRWDFDKIRNIADSAWEKELSKIEVEGGTKNQQKIFYTALYHTLVQPNLYMDVDGKYRGTDHKIHRANDFENYTMFSLWDTFRAVHPLYTITEPGKDVEFIKTFLAMYDNGGILPIWELAGNYTGIMIGYHAVPVIVDAYMKGLRGFNVQKAFEAVKHSADLDHLGIKYYKEYGYVPCNRNEQSVSKTLEYAYDDWCISQMAKQLNREKDYKRFIERAQFYKNLFDPSTGFMRGRLADGSWIQPFVPKSPTYEYTESNAWQYSFFAPQDIEGLIDLYGGREKFSAKLDSLFSTSSELIGRQESNITGQIGQYAHGNEPSHHMAYLYNYAGKPWKTQAAVREIMEKLYSTGPNGLCGNDDCGQLSAWYIFSAIGFYPVTPGSNQYVAGSPVFKKVTINLPGGKHFVIKADNVSKRNKYVREIKLNGKKYNKLFITHSDIISGGKLEFIMSNLPDKNFQFNKSDLPYSITKEDFVSTPFTQPVQGMFIDSISVSLNCLTAGASIYYTKDGSVPGKNSSLYTNPLHLTNSTTIKTAAFKTGLRQSKIMSATFNHQKYLPPVKAKGPVKGVRYKYFEGMFKSVKDFQEKAPLKSGLLDYFSLEPAQSEDHFGFEFNGYIDIQQKGIYRFYLQSDDGSRMYIDGQGVVDNDDSHGTIENSGVIALEKGLHKYSILYMEDWGGQSLKVYYQSELMKKQKIPAEVLFR